MFTPKNITTLLFLSCVLAACGATKKADVENLNVVQIYHGQEKSTSLNQLIGLNLEAITQYNAGNTNKAKNILANALIINPSEATTLFNYGYIFYREKEYSTATHFLTAALNHQYKDDNLIIMLGESLCKINQIKKGTDLIQQNLSPMTKTKRHSAFETIQLCIKLENATS